MKGKVSGLERERREIATYQESDPIIYTGHPSCLTVSDRFGNSSYDAEEDENEEERAVEQRTKSVASRRDGRKAEVE